MELLELFFVDLLRAAVRPISGTTVLIALRRPPKSCILERCLRCAGVHLRACQNEGSPLVWKVMPAVERLVTVWAQGVLPWLEGGRPVVVMASFPDVSFSMKLRGSRNVCNRTG